MKDKQKFIKKLDLRFSKSKIWIFFRELFLRINKNKIANSGAQLTYYLLLGFFPFIIFLLSVITFTHFGDINVIDDVLEFLPKETANLLGPVLKDIIHSRSASLLSFSLFIALWSASSGVRQILRSLDLAFETTKTRGVILQYFVSLLFTILLVIMVIVALSSQVFGDAIFSAIVSFFPKFKSIEGIWNFIMSFAPLIILIFGFAFLYRYGSSKKRKSIPFIYSLAGAICTSIGWTIISFGFKYYVNNFANYSKTYGSLGGIVILMIWLYLSSIIILFGAEVTATLLAIKYPKSGIIQMFTKYGERTNKLVHFILPHEISEKDMLNRAIKLKELLNNRKVNRCNNLNKKDLTKNVNKRKNNMGSILHESSVYSSSTRDLRSRLRRLYSSK